MERTASSSIADTASTIYAAGGGGYEETAYLLLNGKLPTRSELDIFNADLALRRTIPQDVKDLIVHIANKVPPHEYAAHRRLHARLS